MIIKKHITFSERKKSDAQNDIEAEKTAGKILRDTIIETGVGLVREKAYVASNKTDKLLQFAEKSKNIVDEETVVANDNQPATAFSRIAFKETKNISRGNKICTSLYVVLAKCKIVALKCSIIKTIPYKGQIYIRAKIVSKEYMSFKNACSGESY